MTENWFDQFPWSAATVSDWSVEERCRCCCCCYRWWPAPPWHRGDTQRTIYYHSWEYRIIYLFPTQDLTPVFATPGTECGQGELCATRASCPYWAEITELTGTEREDRLHKARENICNKEDRGLCCKMPTTAKANRPLRNEGDTKCNGTDVCTPAEDCDTYKLGTNKLRNFIKQNKTKELRQFRAAMRKKICNKKLRSGFKWIVHLRMN